jgi:hypothetical protein
MYAPSCVSTCNWSVWERVCTKLRFRLVFARTEIIVCIQNYLDRNTLPNTGGGWKVLFHTLEEVSVENEQRDVEGGVSEQLMHESWRGTPAHSSVPYQCTARLNLLWLTNLNK